MHFIRLYLKCLLILNHMNMKAIVAILRGLTDQLVHVRSYVRTRYGRVENVCEHYRRYPNSTIQF